MKVVFMGSPVFGPVFLKALILNKYHIEAVYTQPDRKTGRGQRLTPCPVKQFALDEELPVMQPESFKDSAEVEHLAGLKPDIIVVAAYGQILPDPVLQIPPYKCINIHPSLLPKYRGPSPVAAAILNGDSQTGVTIMLIEKKVDSGPVIAQVTEYINDDDNTGSLTERLAEVGAKLLVDTLPEWISGKICPIRQDESKATYTRMERKEDGELDWNLTAVWLWRKVRACNPWPGSYTKWMGRRINIMETIPLPADAEGVPGQVVELPRGSATRVAVRTGDGLLGLVRIQPEGKREMAAAEFVVGHRNFIGSIL